MITVHSAGLQQRRQGDRQKNRRDRHQRVDDAHEGSHRLFETCRRSRRWQRPETADSSATDAATVSDTARPVNGTIEDTAPDVVRAPDRVGGRRVAASGRD